MIRPFIQRTRNLINRFRGSIENASRHHLAIDRQAFAQLVGKKRPTIRQWLRLPLILSLRERLALALLLATAVISGAFLIRHMWSWWFVPVPAGGGELIEGIVGVPRFLNPLYAPSNPADRDIVRLLFSGLIRFDEHGNIVPDLAERIEMSENGLEYIVVLKEGMRWSDGELVTSEDVRFTIEAAKNPLYQSPLRSKFINTQVRTTDERTVNITLTEPSAPFIENLTTGIIPAHIWSSIDPKNATLAELNIKPVSVGPYQFTSLTKDTAGTIRTVTLTRREQNVPQTPYLKSITIKCYQSMKEAVSALTQKNIDALNGIPADKIKEVKSRKDLNRYDLKMPQYVALFFRAGASPALDQQKVRHALNLAIDRNRIIQEALEGNGSVAEGPFINAMGGFTITASSTPFDAETAKIILDGEGWKISEGETIRKNSKGEELSVSITTLSQNDLFHAAEIVQKNWQAIGVRTTVQITDASRIGTEIIPPRSYQILLIGELLGYDPDPYPFWHSSQIGERGLNLSDYSNRDVDKLLEEARKTNDHAIREKNYQAVQVILQLETPAAFLYIPSYPYMITKEIKGVTNIVVTHPSDRFDQIEQWYENTRWGLKAIR